MSQGLRTNEPQALGGTCTKILRLYSSHLDRPIGGLDDCLI